MWQTVDYKGNTVRWYEAELIKLVSEIAKDIIEDDCDIFKGEAIMANRIMQLIQENER